MAFRELQAMQVAYELLSPLDPSAQQRAMAWLSAALADNNGAPTAVDEPAAPVKPVADVPTEIASGNSVAKVMAEHAPAAPDVETATPAAPAVESAAATEPQVAVEPEPAPDPRPRRRRSAKATDRRAAKAVTATPAAKPAEAAPGRGDRPSGEQFVADLAAAGSFKALAEKYGKSIGTIGNWTNQLREQGFDIPVGRQKKA
jgi:hypothetical protein